MSYVKKIKKGLKKIGKAAAVAWSRLCLAM